MLREGKIARFRELDGPLGVDHFAADLMRVLPLALAFTTGDFGYREELIPTRFYHLFPVVLQAVFAWGMTFGLIGLCRSLLQRDNRLLRHVSDSS